MTIEALSRKYQRQAVRVEIEGEPEEIPSIRQLLITVEADDKPKALRAVLLYHPHESALVFANLKTTARREGDEYVVNGSKMFITSGMRADYYTVAVRTGGEGAGGVSLLLIERDRPGFTRTPLKKQ